jgi:hypothetical protein
MDSPDFLIMSFVVFPFFSPHRHARYLLAACSLSLFAVLSLSAALLQAQPLTGEEYLQTGYNGTALDNPVAELAAKLESGELQLEWRAPRGYFDAFLEALEIDPASQVLVFSKTSLQYQKISWEKPRGVYFNDRTWIGFVQDSDIVEITTLDDKLGAVFYVFNNTRDPGPGVERLNQRCLVCHDSNGTMGGGIPLLLARSGLYDHDGNQLQDLSGIGNTTDQTPFAERWGGWFVTGQHGSQTHLGNVQLANAGELAQVQQHTLGNLDTLAGQNLFDTSPYIRDTSDLIALMVLEHQLTVLNQLMYVKFKAPAVLARAKMLDALQAPTWDALPERAQRTLKRMLDKLVQVLLMQDAIQLAEPISGNAEFRAWFEAQGPRKAQGRSLRELDLESRLFRLPLSYIVQSRDFAMLPAFARDYVWRELAAILQGKKLHPALENVAAADLLAVLQILQETQPGFAAAVVAGLPGE